MLTVPSSWSSFGLLMKSSVDGRTLVVFSKHNYYCWQRECLPSSCACETDFKALIKELFWGCLEGKMVKYHVPWAPGRGGLHVHFGHHILSTFKYIAKSKVKENIFKSPFIVIIVELCLRNGKVGFEIYFFFWRVCLQRPCCTRYCLCYVNNYMCISILNVTE